MAMRKVSLTALQKKLDKINKAMAENKKQRAEVEKAIALQFTKENQK